jgi:hypothetical protein
MREPGRRIGDRRSARRVIRTAVGAALLGLAAAPAAGQGVCAAPHSTGSISSGASAGTLPSGAGRLQLSALRWVSDRFFGPGGEVRSLLSGGSVTTHSLYLAGTFGVLPGLEIHGELPVHDVTFRDQTGTRRRTDLGDFRAAVRFAPAAMGLALPVVLRAGVKLPGSDFPVDATVVPITEGQRDWELRLEYGRAILQPSPLAPPTLYGSGWIGYRWREVNEAAARKPGNERFGRLGFGGVLPPVQWEVAGEIILGEPPVQQGFRLDGARRELWQLSGAFAYDDGFGRTRLGVQLPVAGRNLPTGPSYSLSYAVNWGSF